MRRIGSVEERQRAVREMRERILNVLPAATYQMDTFLKLVDITISDRTPTACVEVGPQPRLHLNEAFVNRYCRKDEHLLMLVMHELYHVILGHTRLFPRVTEAHNIAFDAIINSMLCHQFKETIYIEFFNKVNRSSAFPARLLKPPAGRPGTMLCGPGEGSKREQKVMDLLYGPRNGTVTYHEVFELLRGMVEEGRGKKGGPTGKKPGKGKPVLLGAHENEDGSSQADDDTINNDLFKGIMRPVVGGWPADDRMRLSVNHPSIHHFLMPKPRAPQARFLEALRSLLGKAGVLRPESGSAYAWKVRSCSQESLTFLPQPRDRHAPSREVLLGSSTLLHHTEIAHIRPRWMPQNVSHLYLDISGSMADCLPWLAAALDPLHRKGLCDVYVFSTVVDTIRPGQLMRDKMKNTGGTDINCVYEHIIHSPPSRTPRKVVLLTDGYTGTPNADLHEEWKRRKVELYVGLVGSTVAEQWVRLYAKHIEKLPKPR